MPEKKILFILICINIFLILSTAAYGITRPSTNLTFSPEELSVFSTNADNQEVSVPGYYLDNAIEGSGKYIATPSTILNKGIFNVSVKYQTNNAETDFVKHGLLPTVITTRLSYVTMYLYIEMTLKYNTIYTLIKIIKI